jgi:hypothetical protein
MMPQKMMAPAAAPTAIPAIAPVDRPELELELELEESEDEPLPLRPPSEPPVGAFTTKVEVEKERDPAAFVLVTTTTLVESVSSVVVKDVVSYVENSPRL